MRVGPRKGSHHERRLHRSSGRRRGDRARPGPDADSGGRRHDRAPPGDRWAHPRPAQRGTAPAAPHRARRGLPHRVRYRQVHRGGRRARRTSRHAGDGSPGVPHTFANPGDQPVVVVTAPSPPICMCSMSATCATCATSSRTDGRTDAGGAGGGRGDAPLRRHPRHRPAPTTGRPTAGRTVRTIRRWDAAASRPGSPPSPPGVRRGPGRGCCCRRRAGPPRARWCCMSGRRPRRRAGTRSA